MTYPSTTPIVPGKLIPTLQGSHVSLITHALFLIHPYLVNDCGLPLKDVLFLLSTCKYFSLVRLKHISKMKLNIELGSPLIRTVLQGLGPNVKSAFLDNAFWIESVVARVPNLDTYVYRDYEYKPLFSDTEHIGDFLRSFLSHHSCSQDVIHFVILKRLDIRSADCHVPWELLVNLEQLKCDVVHFTPDCHPPKLRDLEIIVCNEDLSNVRCCRSLRNLKVNVVTVICPVRNYAVDGLGEFPLLEHLNVYDWNLMNLKSIGYIKSLQFLEVEAENALNLSTLSNLQHLKELNLILPNAIDISPLKSLTSLSNLFFVSHKHLDLSPLQHLINLKCLGLNQTVQHDLTVLAALVNLREIDLSEALKLNSIQFVAGMMQLETLILTQSIISNLTPLKNCSQLKILKLEETPISDISTLKYLPQLEILMLRSTMVSDLSALEALTTLLTELEMATHESAPPAPSEGSYANISHPNQAPVKLWYKQFGTGPTKLLFVMGMNTTHRSWCYQYAYFSSLPEYTCLVFDNRGVGFSDAPPGPYTTPLMALDTLSLLTHVGWTEGVHVVGSSMGGMILQELVLAAPVGLVASLTLTSTNAGKVMPPLGSILGIPKLMFTTDMRAKKVGVVALNYSREWLGQESVDVKGKSNQEVRVDALMEDPEQSVDAANAQFSAALKHYVSKERLKGIVDKKVPVLVVTGTNDQLVNPSNSIYLAKALEAKVYRKFEGAGHLVNVECSQEYNATLKSFIEGL
ncbi:hypothetical protein HDU79_003182 [Rhizoclosmatium sp. JEL0117]|nr:hypothetical protein HDU79_003182 [Rhizoclosmatium sp. JEL0117]